jgi:trans-aconitate methyltransferase
VELLLSFQPMDDALRQQLLQKAQGALQLQLAYFGVSAGLFDRLDAPMSMQDLAAATGNDADYLVRWADAAYAVELLERETDGDSAPRFLLTATGRAFRRDTPGTLFPLAVQVVLGAHMAERATTLAKSGERPGEQVLGERESILPLFGPMLEHAFGPMFDAHILGAVPVFEKVNAEGGLAVDLGCGNGWYLRRLAKRCTHLRGIGLDSFAESIRQANAAAENEGLSDRVRFQEGDLHQFQVDEPAALIAMNRALHHVWETGDRVFEIMSEHLGPGGAAVIWEPAWPSDVATLRNHPRFRAMAFQNLAEHVQGNHFLIPEEIAEALSNAGLEPKIYRLLDDTEAVIVGTKPA